MDGYWVLLHELTTSERPSSEALANSLLPGGVGQAALWDVRAAGNMRQSSTNHSDASCRMHA